DRGTLTGSPPTGISGTPAWEEDLAYDPDGNWSNYTTKISNVVQLNQDRTHDKANEITGFTTHTGPGWPVPTYTAVGTTYFMPRLDMNSSMRGLYDAWNRLVNLEDNAIYFATYKYDGLNRRIRSVTI